MKNTKGNRNYSPGTAAEKLLNRRVVLIASGIVRTRVIPLNTTVAITTNRVTP